jgi:hypothetical protein
MAPATTHARRRGNIVAPPVFTPVALAWAWGGPTCCGETPRPCTPGNVVVEDWGVSTAAMAWDMGGVSLAGQNWGMRPVKEG